MPDSAAPIHLRGRRDPSARVKLVVSAVAGCVVAVIAAILGAGASTALVGWDVLALVFTAWVWWSIWPCGHEATADHARAQNPGRDAADVILVAAAVASLIAVGLVLFSAGHANGNAKYVQAGFAVVSVVVSWALVHTVFTLKYARLYYSAPVGGIDFNESDPPQYSDFAYLAFTIGMTFQVSDTDLQTKAIRRTALRHAWLSFPLGTVIIAASINLISGLAK